MVGVGDVTSTLVSINLLYSQSAHLKLNGRRNGCAFSDIFGGEGMGYALALK